MPTTNWFSGSGAGKFAAGSDSEDKLTQDKHRWRSCCFMPLLLDMEVEKSPVADAFFLGHLERPSCTVLAGDSFFLFFFYFWKSYGLPRKKISCL